MKSTVALFMLIIMVNVIIGQKALKIKKADGTENYLNISSVDKITFETPLAVGDEYQGGVIIYLDSNGEHGLIAAYEDQSDGVQWWNGSFTVTSATGDTAGAGEGNTSRIIGSQGDGSYAAKLCYDYTFMGYSDWYLPSKYELSLMYELKSIINLKSTNNGFAAFSSSGYYCSSTEIDQWFMWAIEFTLFDGTPTMSGKGGSSYHVRAIRAF